MEKSCGGVVFTRRDGIIHYVIIRHLGGHWGFPKGHMEPGETECQTALREIHEEVGLHCTLLEGFRREIQYALPKKSTVKQVVYFLAEYEGQNLRPQPEEIAQIALLPYEQTLEQLTHQQSKNILMDANAFLC